MHNSGFHYATCFFCFFLFGFVFISNSCHSAAEWGNKKGNWEKQGIQTLAFILCQLQHEVSEQITCQATLICPHTVRVVKHLCWGGGSKWVFSGWDHQFVQWRAPFEPQPSCENSGKLCNATLKKGFFKGRIVILTSLTYETVNCGLIKLFVMIN